jgi:hypothetical protein
MAPLRYRQIFHFYWPLVLTSQMMTLTAPIINMGLGRNEDPKIQLAAYSVGFSLLLVFNACLFPFLQAVTVLATGPASRRSLLIKGLAIGAVIAFWELLLGVSPWGSTRTKRSSPQLASRTRWAACAESARVGRQ